MGDDRKNREARPDTALKLDKIKNSGKSTDSTYSFSGRLQDIRKDRGLTQEEAAKGLNMKLNTYRKLEQGVNRSDAAEYICRLADFYGVSADRLLGRDLTEPLNYDTVTKKTGLNSRSIRQLMELHLQDGAEDGSPGYMDFVNCFLGNETCTGLFFEALMPILRNLYGAAYGEHRSSDMTEVATARLARHVTEYIKKVVVPTYGQLYHEGQYASADVCQYLTDDAVKKKQ